MVLKSLAQDDTGARSESGFRAESFGLHSLRSEMKSHECNLNLFTCVTSQGSWKAKIIVPVLYFRKLGLGEAEQPRRLTGLESASAQGRAVLFTP